MRRKDIQSWKLFSRDALTWSVVWVFLALRETTGWLWGFYWLCLRRALGDSWSLVKRHQAEFWILLFGFPGIVVAYQLGITASEEKGRSMMEQATLPLVLGLAGFAVLVAVVMLVNLLLAPARVYRSLTKEIRAQGERIQVLEQARVPRLVIGHEIDRRGDAKASGETFGLLVTNTSQSSADNCEGQIIEMRLLDGTSEMKAWPIGNLQWAQQGRTEVGQEGRTSIGGSLSATLDIIHRHSSGFSKHAPGGYPRPHFLFAYANDAALRFDNPPPSNQKVLLSIAVRGADSPPSYTVCVFNPVPDAILEWGPVEEDGRKKLISSRLEPHLEVLCVAAERVDLANFEQPIPRAVDSQPEEV